MRRPQSILRRLVHRPKTVHGYVPNLLPEAKRIGEGCARTAYRVGNYVVKEAGFMGTFSNQRNPPKTTLRRLGILPPQQWFRNGWVVQPWYRLNRRSPVHGRTSENDFYDLHPGNIGFDTKGRPVAFDW